MYVHHYNLYRRQIISVTDHILCVDENFSQHNPFVQCLGDSKYAWYSKSKNSGGLGLDTLICIKDSSNKIIHGPFNAAIVLKAELVYENGLAPPKFVLAPTKSKKSTKISLFKPLSPIPIFDANGRNEYCSFKFRINEVSFHHPEQSAFKIKVSAASSPLPIKPGFLKESIIVLSKPKSGTNTWLKAETSASVAINDIPQKMPENSKINPRAVSVRPRLKSTKVAVPKKRKATPGSYDIDNFLPNKRARVVSSEYANAVPAFPVSSCHSVTTAPLVTPHTFPFDDALSNIPVIVNAEEVHNQDEICILNAFKKIAWRNFQDWCH